MESLGTAVLELVADIKPLAVTLKEGQKVSEEMAKTTASGFKGGITKAAIPAAAAVGALVIGLHKSLDAAEENQVSEAKLAQAFKTAGLNIEDYKDKIDKTEQASAGLGFKSEDVKAALAQLVVATHDAHSAMNLLATAQDLARYKGISLTDASKMLTSTMSGSTRAARALGIVFQPVTAATDALKAKTQYASLAAYEHAKSVAFMADKQASAQKMVEMLNQKLGGQADAFSKTAQGAKEKMGAEFQLLEINIGNALIPILTKVSMVLANFSAFLTEHAKVVKIVLLVIGTLASAILLYTGYVRLAAAAQLLWNGIMDANPIGLIIVAVAALVVAFVELWKHSQTFRDIIEGVWNDVTTATTTFTSFFTSTVPSAFQTVVDWLTGTWTEVTNDVAKPFNDAWTLIKGIPGDITDAFAIVKTWFNNAAGWVFDTFIEQPFKSAWSFIAGIPGDITDGFGKIKGWFNGAADWAIKTFITQPFSDAWDFIKGIPGDIVTAFGDVKDGLGRVLSGAGGVIKKLLTAPINGVIGLIDSIEIPKIHINMPWPIPDINFGPYGPFFHIPYLAQGGIVTSPTLAMIGEAGPEAVVPLSGGNAGGLGGGITVHVSGVVGNERDVAVKIGRELQKLKTRGLDFGLA